ncbi:MAG: ABC transporter permease [Desulfobacterales bacterium]|nr:ABC transporter permease [Desulfobacterales bacterium]MBS3756040.1 ABC transporter permease [Desulfobacterales bacterium]
MSNPIRHHQFFHLIAAHAKEIIREPAVIFWGIIFPMLISLGLGLSFTQTRDVVHHVGVISDSADAGRNDSKIHAFLREHGQKVSEPAGHAPKYRLTVENPQLGDTTFVFTQTDWKTATVLLKRDRLHLIVEPAGGGIEYHFDPRNPDAELAYLKLTKAISGRPVASPEIAGNIEPLTVTGTRYIDFLVPGLITMGAMMSCMWGISYGMIDKRSKKLLRRMVATPMRKSNFLMALMVVRIGMNIIEAVLLFIFAYLVFDIAVQGSIAALIVIFLAGNIAFCGIAIFVSSRTANTEVGNGLVNAVVLPMTVMSGIFFSYHNFPDWSVPFIQKLPLTLFTDGIRSIFNEGAGFVETGIPAAILVAVGGIFFSLGLRVFRWH